MRINTGMPLSNIENYLCGISVNYPKKMKAD